MAGLSTSITNNDMSTNPNMTSMKGASPDVATHAYLDMDNFKVSSETVKKNSKMEFSQSDLLKLLSYLEGELQARDVVIAALKSENVKHLLYATRCQSIGPNDPQAALYRDKLASIGNLVSRQSSASAAQSELGMRVFARQQLDSLEGAVQQQRIKHQQLLALITESEEKYKNLLNELEEEKKKHERDTAQGDDITYGLEVERTRLRQDLEEEKAAGGKLEKELKQMQETLDAERARQKTIVLLLLAERKRIIMKYIEERKRSEDLAQILSEEKQRVDLIAEGLEEESKKSLRMEADLETQMQTIEAERKIHASALENAEKKFRDQDQEISKLKAENDLIRKQPQHRISSGLPQLPLKGIAPRLDSNDDNAASGSPLMSSVTKVIQPTATVSSVPVSGPTTGIARSISPGQTMRHQSQIASSDISAFNAVKVTPRKLSNVSVPIIPTMPANSQIVVQQQPQPPIIAPASKINVSTIKKTPVASLSVSRGVPPPIPPNKPVVPPKRESSVTRLVGNPIPSSSTTTTIATGVAVATFGSTEETI